MRNQDEFCIVAPCKMASALQLKILRQDHGSDIPANGNRDDQQMTIARIELPDACAVVEAVAENFVGSRVEFESADVRHAADDAREARSTLIGGR